MVKRDIKEASIEHLKSLFNSIDWNIVTQTLLPNDSYNIFLEKFVQIYNQAFPERKAKESCQSLDYLGFEKIFKEETASL